MERAAPSCGTAPSMAQDGGRTAGGRGPTGTNPLGRISKFHGRGEDLALATSKGLVGAMGEFSFCKYIAVSCAVVQKGFCPSHSF